MQGSKVELQGTGTVTAHSAWNTTAAYSTMPAHMYATLNQRQTLTQACKQQEVRCLRLPVASTHKVNQWETKEREILVDSSIQPFTSLGRRRLAVCVLRQVMFNIIASVICEYSWMARIQVQR